jgi:hypothetical protein
MCTKDAAGNKAWDCGKCDCLTSFARHAPVTDEETGVRACSKCGVRL